MLLQRNDAEQNAGTAADTFSPAHSGDNTRWRGSCATFRHIMQWHRLLWAERVDDSWRQDGEVRQGSDSPSPRRVFDVQSSSRSQHLAKLRCEVTGNVEDELRHAGRVGVDAAVDGGHDRHIGGDPTIGSV